MWSPGSLDEVLDLIRQSEAEMNPAERRIWKLLQVPPAKWQLHPWGDAGGGFWAVGLIGLQVVWYNDIEQGFNISPYAEPGTVGDYRCNQGSLQPVLWGLLHEIETGEASGAFGPPRPIDESAEA